MRNKKVIDPFLNKKILENERKIQFLFDTELSKSQSKRAISRPATDIPSERNIHHKKYRSQDEIFMDNSDDDNNADDNNGVSPYKSTIETKSYSKTIPNRKNYNSTSYLKKNVKNRMNPRKKLKQEEEKNNRNNRNNRNYHTASNNNMSQLNNTKSKRIYNKEEVDNIVNRLYNNYYKHKKKPCRDDKEISTVDFTLNTEANETPVKKGNEQSNVNVDEMIERFQEDIKKRNKRIEQKREELKNNEKK